MMPPRLPVRPAAKTKPSTTSRISQDIDHIHIHIHQDTEAPMPPHTTFHKRRRRRDPHQQCPDPTHSPRSEWRSRRSWCSPGVCLALILLSTACSVLGASSESAGTSTTISSAEQTDLAVTEPDDSTGIQPSAGGCAPQHWWDSNRNRCIPCTRCQDEMIPLRPCQLHTDTICGSIYDLKIDWVVLAKTEPNWKEVSHGRHNPLSVLSLNTTLSLLSISVAPKVVRVWAPGACQAPAAPDPRATAAAPRGGECRRLGAWLADRCPLCRRSYLPALLLRRRLHPHPPHAPMAPHGASSGSG